MHVDTRVFVCCVNAVIIFPVICSVCSLWSSFSASSDNYSQIFKRFLNFTTLSVYAFDVGAFWYKNLPILQVHASTTGQIFKSQLQTKHVELLQSPWLVELIAFHLNLRDNMKSDSEIASRCVCDFESPRPTLSFLLSDAIKLEVALTCSVCLVSYSVTCINSL